MTIQEQVEILGKLTRKTETGVRIYREADLAFLFRPRDVAELESAGLIQIHRPIHEPSGIQYSPEYWTVEVTGKGQDLVDQGWSL